MDTANWILFAIALLLLAYAVRTLTLRSGGSRVVAPGVSARVTSRSIDLPAVIPRRGATILSGARTLAATVPVWPAVAALGTLSVFCWAAMYAWYTLFGHYTTPDFAFDKIPDHFDSPVLQLTTLLMLILVLCYLAIYALTSAAPRLSRRVIVAAIVFVGIAALINVVIYPVGALDVYNYIIELKLTYFYHQNPYIVTFHAHTNDPFARFAFFLDMPLFYGPAWLLLSRLPTLLTGFGDVQQVLIGLKVFNLVLLVATAGVIYAYQDDRRRGWLAAYLFLANPLVLFEGIGNAHNDVMMGLFMAAAVLALKRRSWLAGPLLMLSVLVKFFTASLIPLFLLAMLLRRWGRQRIMLSVLASVAVAVLIAAPFWAGGSALNGLLTGTNASQEMSSTSIFSLVREYLGQHNASPDAVSLARTVCLGLFGVCALVVLWTVRRGRAFEAAMIDTFLLFSVLISLLYPWYLIPVLAIIALRRDGAAFFFLCGATTLGLVYHPLSVWAWFNSGMSAFEIHLFQAIFLTLPVLLLILYEAGRQLGRMSRLRLA